VSKLASTDLGKTYISHTLLNIVSKINSSKVDLIKNELLKLGDKKGLEFIESIKHVINKNFSDDERTKINMLLGYRLSNAIVSKSAVYDPVISKLYSINSLTNEIEIKELNIEKERDRLELYKIGLLDKSRDFLVDYSEYRMFRIIEEGIQKGMKGKDLGKYVYSRLKEELRNDPYFFECFKYYLARYLEQLEKSKEAMQAFGDLLVMISRVYRRLMYVIVRAAEKIPIFGSVAGALASGGQAIEELGEGIRRTLKILSNKRK